MGVQFGRQKIWVWAETSQFCLQLDVSSHSPKLLIWWHIFRYSGKSLSGEIKCVSCSQNFTATFLFTWHFLHLINYTFLTPLSSLLLHPYPFFPSSQQLPTSFGTFLSWKRLGALIFGKKREKRVIRENKKMLNLSECPFFPSRYKAENKKTFLETQLASFCLLLPSLPKSDHKEKYSSRKKDALGVGLTINFISFSLSSFSFSLSLSLSLSLSYPTEESVI